MHDNSIIENFDAIEFFSAEQSDAYDSDPELLRRIEELLPALKKKLLVPGLVQMGTQYADPSDPYPKKACYKRYPQYSTEIDRGLLLHFTQRKPVIQCKKERGGLGLFGNFKGAAKWFVFDADNASLTATVEKRLLPELERAGVDYVHVVSGTADAARCQIWIFVEQMPLHIVRRFADAIAEISQIQFIMPEAHDLGKLLEIMPTHTNNIIRLPGGFHLKTATRNPVIHGGEVYEDSVGIINALIAAKTVSLEFMRAYGVDVDSPPPPPPEKKEVIRYGTPDGPLLEAVRNALNYIIIPDEDGGRRYEIWRNVFMAAKSAGIPYELVDDWARGQSAYNEKKNLEQWNAFSDDPDAGISLGTINYLARLGGWTGKFPSWFPPAEEDFEDLDQEQIEKLKEQSEKNRVPDTLLALAVKIHLRQIPFSGTEVSEKIAVLVDKTYTKTALNGQLKHFISCLTRHKTWKERSNLAKKKAQEDERLNAAADDLLKCPNIFKAFHQDFSLTGYLADETLTTIGLLLLGRTLMNRSSGQYHYGKTASGKTEFVSALCSFFPSERVITITKATNRFLIRYGELDDGMKLSGMLINLCEIQPVRDGEDDPNQEIMRQLISDNIATLATNESVPGVGWVPQIKTAFGPVTFVCTGTSSPQHFDDQFANRMTHCWHNLSQEKIAAILKTKASSGDISSNPQNAKNAEIAERLAIWQHAFRKLYGVLPKFPGDRSRTFTTVQPEWISPKTIDSEQSSDSSFTRSSKCEYAFNGVQIPFLERIQFNRKRLTESDARTFDILKSAVATSALLHQRSREIISGEDGSLYIVATLDDLQNVKLAYHTMAPNTAQSISNDLLERFCKIAPSWKKKQKQGEVDQGLSYAEIADLAGGVPIPTVKRWIYAWIGADLVHEEPMSFVRRKLFMLADDWKELSERIQENAQIEIRLLDPENARTDERMDSKASLDGLLGSATFEMNGRERSVNVHLDPYAALAGI